MGRVGVHNNGSNIWDKVNFSDIEVVKGLIRFRNEYDLLYQRERLYNMKSNGDLADLSEDIICLYADLDNLINKVSLNNKQKRILNLHMAGISVEEIAENYSTENRNIEGVLDTICEKIVEANYEDWKLGYVYWNKKRVDSNYKRCSKCEDFLPVAEDYFSPNALSRDGFYSICRKCKQIMDKNRKNERFGGNNC